MRSFSHSGKAGDVIYSLPAVRALGGGALVLRPSGRIGFSEESARALETLLLTQPYVESLSVDSNAHADIDLDAFRAFAPLGLNLADCHLLALGLPTAERERPWLRVPSPTPDEDRPVLVARTERHRGVPEFWDAVWPLIRDKARFLGSRDEHAAFEAEVGEVPWVATPDLLDAARVISGCDLFVGNQSALLAIAEGLKATCIQEVCLHSPNCRYQRSGMLTVRTASDLARVPAFVSAALHTTWRRDPTLPPEPVIDRATAGLLGPASLAGTSVVVLTFNSMATLGACVRSVQESLGPADELILVDNGSTDGTQRHLPSLASKDQRTRVLLLAENTGYSAGCNTGMKISRGSTIALLNPDTEVRAGWLEALRARLSDPQVGAVGPVSDKVSGDQYVGHHLPADQQRGLNVDQLAWSVSQHHKGESLETKLLIGFCLVLRRETLNQVGLLDENLFLGADDLEISWRLRSHGLRLLVARDVFVHHEHRASFNTLPSQQTQRWLAESDEALRGKICDAYGSKPPDSQVLWGSDIFSHALPGPPRQASSRQPLF
jgi:GT2 family glycosyltransferase